MTGSDLREARIILQNSMAHATQIHLHNAKLENKKVEALEILATAKLIAKEIINLGKGK
jgi:hypothetical protein